MPKYKTIVLEAELLGEDYISLCTRIDKYLHKKAIFVCGTEESPYACRNSDKESGEVYCLDRVSVTWAADPFICAKDGFEFLQRGIRCLESLEGITKLILVGQTEEVRKEFKKVREKFPELKLKKN